MKAVPLVIAGLKDEEIAKEVGVTRQTVNKWKNQDLEFIDYLEYHRVQLYKSHCDEVKVLTTKALKILNDAVESGDQKTKLDLAKTILRNFKIAPIDLSIEHPEIKRGKHKIAKKKIESIGLDYDCVDML